MQARITHPTREYHFEILISLERNEKTNIETEQSFQSSSIIIMRGVTTMNE
jgi:hypothetical protein